MAKLNFPCLSIFTRSRWLTILAVGATAQASAAQHEAWRSSGGLYPQCVIFFSQLAEKGPLANRGQYSKKSRKLLEILEVFHGPKNTELMLVKGAQQYNKHLSVKSVALPAVRTVYLKQCNAVSGAY